jgi:hypothetical protein
MMAAMPDESQRGEYEALKARMDAIFETMPGYAISSLRSGVRLYDALRADLADDLAEIDQLEAALEVSGGLDPEVIRLGRRISQRLQGGDDAS